MATRAHVPVRRARRRVTAHHGRVRKRQQRVLGRGRRHEGGRRGPRGGDVAAAAVGTPVGILAGADGGTARGGAALVSSSRLVAVPGILDLVPQFFFFRELLPLVLYGFGLVAPLLADDFGDFRVGEPRVGLYHVGLVVLAVEDKGCFLVVFGSVSWFREGERGREVPKKHTVTWSGNFWRRRAQTDQFPTSATWVKRGLLLLLLLVVLFLMLWRLLMLMLLLS